MSDKLTEIMAWKRQEIAALVRPVSERELADLDARTPKPPSFAAALRRPDGALAVIAEIKRRSPSAGALSTALDVGERARAYERAGASMLSVLTDAKYFDGAFAHLRQAREATHLPILCKEFVLDERQLDWARASGADAVLLVVRCLTPAALAGLLAAARERGLAPLVEVASAEEARVALDAGADLIGVNARDLDTLQMDAARAQRVLDGLPSGVTRVFLSGVRSEHEVRQLASQRLDATLIGEALMRLDDPSALLARMRAAAG